MDPIIMEAYSEQALVALAIVFAVIPLIFVSLRLWTKKFTPYGIRTDDWLSVGALSITIGSTASMLIAILNGRLGEHMIPGPDGQPDLSNPNLPAFEESKFAFTILSVLGLGFAKTSVLVYCRHTINNRPYRILVDVFLGLVLAYTIAYMMASIFTCSPVTSYTEPVFGNSCTNSALVQTSSAFVNCGLDLLILFVPVLMAMLRKTASGLHRLGLVAVFIIGMLATAVSVVRGIVTLQAMYPSPELANDLTFINAPLFIWTIIELSLSVLVGCLATLRPLFGGQSIGVPKNPGYTIGYATQVYSSADGVDGRWTPLGSIKSDIQGGRDPDKDDAYRPAPLRKQSETPKWGAEMGGVRVEHSLNIRAESRQEVLGAEPHQGSTVGAHFEHRQSCPMYSPRVVPTCEDCGGAVEDFGVGHAV